MKRIAILGSTGSIGTQALDVIARHPSRFEVAALAAGRRTPLLLEQARRFRPALVSCAREDEAADLRAALPAGIGATSGAAGLRAVAAESGADLVVAATDGAVAFEAVFAAVERGIDVAVANKELIVAAGELLFAAARAGGARVLPIDSEHSALFQCLVGEPLERVAMLVLTASGGPFWTLDAAQMRGASLADALRHPTWRMGTKNTVDSATMMNKGLEVIEASRFFGLEADRIEVLVHRSSVAHGFAIFTDGSIKAHLALPDMRVPIGYALAYPDRLDDIALRDPLAALGGDSASESVSLTFERPDFERFPCLGLAYAALRRGGTAPAALSAGNEVAVDAFVRGRIAFHEIAEVVAATLSDTPEAPLTLGGVRTADAQARTVAERLVGQRSGGPPVRESVTQAHGYQVHRE
jgi:1-deoxy-D-xylulose-5-phosphate reductoisomerase